VQAVRIAHHGGPDVLELVDLPIPEPGPGEVLARVIAASINHLDLWVRRGIPGAAFPLPLIPGCDGTGEIAAVGEGVRGVRVGQPVVLLPGFSSGESPFDLVGDDHLSDDYHVRGEHGDGYDCEFVVLEERFVVPLPDGVDPVQAAAVPLVFVTAWGMLITRAALEAGERVLVLAGSSGVGAAAIQIARDLGARVVTTAGSDSKRARAHDLGAEEVFDHYDPDWSKQVKAWSGGRGVDVVVEHVGPATWDASMRCLARRGRLVTCGGTTGPKVSLLLPHLFMKNIAVHGSTMGPRSAFPAIFEKVAAGDFLPGVDRVLPLSQVVAAHRALEAGEVNGKVVLTPDP
jgi:NADPH2:quinone reductase